MTTFLRTSTLAAAIVLTGGCHSARPAEARGQQRVGYVLHVLNDFSESIKRGAEDAGKALRVDVDVQGPAGASSQDAIGIFEGMVQRRVDGLVVVPSPGDVWVNPIRRAVQAGLPVLTANITSVDAPSPAWFGQDERQSGVILATALRKALEDRKRTEGKVVVGICAPGVAVLQQRYDGLVEGLRGTKIQVSEPRDVTVPNSSNYTSWESLAGANPNALAFVGLCSMDVPNLAKVKSRTGGSWLVLGYDLNQESLDALRNGTAEVLVGQHPYLQGYLPVRALVELLRDHRPVPKGWIDVGTEVVRRADVDGVYARETNRDVGRRWYDEYMQAKFADLGSNVKPLPTGR